MTDDAVQSAENTEAAEAQQIPITIQPPELPSAAVEARDQLLAAIAAEAQAITAKQSGKGAEALEALARAYVQVTAAPAVSVAPLTATRQAGALLIKQTIPV
ncbi:hypothetical protein DFR70_1367 [Nocardia tenerifensis]|uniref:Uncharacterized protein n=1 Tax=Nocardia tenerifensis TaxID=228006 RepID=A0A318JJW2_9NOCA|nr:hypothetical protein [Nocardia tenerifensis]PXX52178.1 hypothetical protein DFR70_1367 [Nocardia tenerifensis]